MTEFTMLMDGKERRVSVINYDLHCKGTDEYLYGIIVPNDNYKIQQDKWLWKLDEFLTADRILCVVYYVFFFIHLLHFHFYIGYHVTFSCFFIYNNIQYTIYIKTLRLTL